MMEPTTYSADMALAEALAKLKSMEEDYAMLQTKVKQHDSRAAERPEGGGAGGDGSVVGGRREMERLHKQNAELMHVNNQWDLEYKDLQEVFRKYRIDSQQAQGENQSLIAKLKEVKERLTEEIRELQVVINRKDKEVSELRLKVRCLEDELHSSKIRFGKPMVSQERLRELEEESHMLRQQLKAYQDDFNAERKDRERMGEEKQSAAIRYEAEVTSLKLQLERCRNELTHYTAEASRLSQQLRLKAQIEEDQYKRHLESNGYITRSPGHLPPLDPFVEIDEDTTPTPPAKPAGRVLPNPSISPRLLTRGVDLVQAYSNSQGAQAYSNSQVAVHRTDSQDADRSRSPIMKNGTGPSYLGSDSNNPALLRRSASPIPNGRPASPMITNTDHTHNQGGMAFKPNFPPSMVMTNGSAASNGLWVPAKRYAGSSNGVMAATSSNGLGGSAFVNTYHMQDQVGVARHVHHQEQVIGRSTIPPLETNGKYSCPRCERKFESKKICSDHKARCIL